MTDAAGPIDVEAAAAARDLARVQAKVATARQVLVRLLQDVVAAESRLSSSQAARVVEANEALVVAAMRIQTDADIAARALNEVSRAAELDGLTQLPNRALLLDRLGHAIAQAARHGTRLALLFLDLDNFKQINDTMGHGAGDELLKQVAQCLAFSIRAADTVSRYGGDEFLILLTDVAAPADAGLIAHKAIASLAAMRPATGQTVRVTASVGISLYPDDGVAADQLIALADAAMYRAKQRGPGGIAFHGQALVDEPTPVPAPLPKTASDFERVLAEHERRNAMLREANEQLVLAAVSAQELQAAAEQARQQQAEFLAVVAQELRDPLAPIRIATALLGRDRRDEPLMPRVQAIVEQQLTQMSRLVGDLLDASLAGSGDTLRMARIELDLAAPIGEALRACGAAMAARQQQLDVRLPPGALPVQGDPARLAQVVSNLLVNASMYTPQGGTIGLSVALAGDALVMTVTDNGIGISAQALPHVFDPFVQDSHAIGLNDLGLGIGLTVVRALVQAHGGSVLASSAGAGQGSQFTVTLPLAAGSAAPARAWP